VKVSIKDIAHSLGVSTALVSYVLNGKEKEARIGKEIAEKIRKKATDLNYQPNQIARSLKSGKTYTIGVIVADISNPFFANISRIIEDEAKKNGYTVIFGSSDESPDKLRDLIDVFLKRQVDGLIISPTVQSESYIANLQRQKVPFVLIDRYFPELTSNYIATDNYKAAYDAVSHLIKGGYKRICMIAYNIELVHMQQRKGGYLDALKEHNLVESGLLLREVSHVNLKEDIENVIQELISKNSIDAIFFATNALATRGLKTLNKFNIKIPDDLAIVTFDESEAFDFFYSPLTFVRQPSANMAKEAVRVILQSINNESKNQLEQICLASELVVRSSSGFKQ
jgi:LacI family transcriptional regulator